jgi:GH18 family chitinase
MVTYDTKEVAIQKSEFVRDWNLGGAMWWESSGDKAGPDSLIGTVSTRHIAEQTFRLLRSKLTKSDIGLQHFATLWKRNRVQGERAALS